MLDALGAVVARSRSSRRAGARRRASRGRSTSDRRGRRPGPRASRERAEAWFYLGAAYGARVQWRVLREQRLAAARDGKRIKESLERALGARSGDARRAVTASACIATTPTSRRRSPVAALAAPAARRQPRGRAAADRWTRAIAAAGARRSRLPAPPDLSLVREALTDALAIVRGLQARLSAQSALPADRSGDPRRLLPRSRGQPAASTAAARRAPLAQARLREPALASVRRAPQHCRSQLDRLGRTGATRSKRSIGSSREAARAVRRHHRSRETRVARVSPRPDTHDRASHSLARRVNSHLIDDRIARVRALQTSCVTNPTS